MKAIIIFIMLCLLGGCKASSLDFNHDYPDMKDIAHVYEKIDFKQAKTLFTEGTGVVILGFDSNKKYCPYCHAVIPVLNEVALEVGCPKIYYLDIYDMRMNNTSEYQTLLILISSQVDDLLIRNEVKTLVVPDVYFIKDGVIVSHHIATLYDESNNFIAYLSDEDKTTLKAIYQAMFAELDYKKK
jgi:thiol-disulfide isomerase/thioredoxin